MGIGSHGGIRVAVAADIAASERAISVRHEEGRVSRGRETPEEANEEDFVRMIKAYVQRLSEEMPSIDVDADYDEFYDEAPARLIHTMDPARLKK